MGGPVTHVFAGPHAEKARCGFLPRGPYTPTYDAVTCPGCTDHEHMGWPRTLKVDCATCRKDINMTTPFVPRDFDESDIVVRDGVTYINMTGRVELLTTHEAALEYGRACMEQLLALSPEERRALIEKVRTFVAVPK